ncbi:cytochrome oxidase assembly protein ShyY1 [Streptosporangium becharense]|uniref:SURF1-like protein n=1 Tax=Streptosporangium becharense TaxID=1816182 RepID=A0A7W9IHI1_9ACTN|nr:SURF1 family cytochrome oxidase biogenesis protein [Streptosporangium becharense]MBB2912651.1 cytochrome oxidase assembly protein ShyY1 [Streptosporangium becharense]MBB5820520.1 cytochrome oxidase assembly protein ShyY1 [Streptosporangium becharense]
MPTLEYVYRFLLTPRWLALHVVVLLVIPAFVLLGQWQFGRYEERSTSSHQITANLAAAPVPAQTLTSPGGTIRDQDKYRIVTVTGTFDSGAQLLVRRRTQDRAVGFYVLTPLKTADGTGVLVNRGWVRAGATADALPEVPPPTSGEVSVTGRLRASETEETSGIRDRAGLPAGQVLLINTEAIGRTLPYRLLGGYVELTSQSPEAAAVPAPVPAPDVGGGGGLNLAYGVQWWLFIGIAIGGWFLLIRREAADRRAAAEAGPVRPPVAKDAAKDDAGTPKDAAEDDAGTPEDTAKDAPGDASEDTADAVPAREAGAPARGSEVPVRAEVPARDTEQAGT